MPSDTFLTCTPGRSWMDWVTASAWSASTASQDTSTTMAPVGTGLHHVQSGQRPARGQDRSRQFRGGADRGRYLGADGDRIPGTGARHGLAASGGRRRAVGCWCRGRSGRRCTAGESVNCVAHPAVYLLNGTNPVDLDHQPLIVGPQRRCFLAIDGQPSPNRVRRVVSSATGGESFDQDLVVGGEKQHDIQGSILAGQGAVQPLGLLDRARKAVQ